MLSNDKCYDERCDVWSLGLIFFEMLTGRHLFNVVTKPQLVQAIKSEIVLPSSLPVHWGALIQQMLAYDFKQRPTLRKLHLLFEEADGISRKRYLEENLEVSQLCA